MSKLFSYANYAKPLILSILIVGMVLFLNACSEDEPEATPDENQLLIESAPTVEEKDSESTVDKVPDLEMPDVVPETLSVLGFMPAEAQIAFALPSIPGMRDKALPLLRLLYSEEDVDETLAEAISDLGNEIGVQAQTYEELAAALGVDAQAPLAVFADFSRMVNSAAAAQMADDSNESSDVEVADSVADEAGEIAGDGGDGAEEVEEVEADLPDFADDIEMQAVAFVLGLADPVKARAELERIADSKPNLSEAAKSTETVGSVELSVRGDYAYFTTEDHMVLGDLALVRSAAGRIENPARIRYGTVECPATASDEVALLLYGSRFLPLMDQVMPMFLDSEDDAMVSMMQSQLAMYEGMFAQGEEEDPIVGTLSWVDDQLEILWRADSNVNTGLLEKSGKAEPLRLARYLPDNTLAMLSLRFNEVFKQQFMTETMPAIQASSGVNMAMASQIIPQLGDELTLGITDVEDDVAGVYLMLGLAQPEATQGLLQMAVSMEGGTEYNGYTINSLPVPSPAPLYLSFVDDFAVAGTSESGIKAIIDRHAGQSVSGVFAAMNPPFDIELPRYQALNFNADVLGAPLTNLMVAFGGDAADSEDVIGTASAIVRELRVANELEGGWMNGRMTIYLNNLTAAAVALEAMALDGELETTTEEKVEAE